MNQAHNPVVDFVRSLTGDGLAAIELLGTIPAEQTADGSRIRIPNDFPIPEGDREAFYHLAQGVGLLRTVGTNAHGVERQVWELNQTAYEQILSAMSELGRASTPRPGSPPSEEATCDQDESTVSEVPSDPPEVVDLPTLRSKLSSARAERARCLAESRELGTQYEATVGTISEVARSIAEMQARLRELNEHRLRLKRGVKDANVRHALACVEAKQFAKRVAAAERASLDSVATTALDLLISEAHRTGIPVEQILAKMRNKLPPKA